MASIVRGKADAAVRALKNALNDYEAVHAGAQATLYRSNPGSIRIRVIDRRFKGMSKSRRHEDVWNFLASRVPEDIMAEVSQLIPLAPAELKTSFANQDFEDPLPLRV